MAKKDKYKYDKILKGSNFYLYLNHSIPLSYKGCENCDNNPGQECLTRLGHGSINGNSICINWVNIPLRITNWNDLHDMILLNGEL